MVKEFDLGKRLQALTLHSEGYSRSAIIEKTGYTPSGLSYLLTTAKKRGYEPSNGLILREYVENKAGRGRLPLLSGDQKNKILEILTSDKASRKFSTQELANKFNEQSGDRSVSRRTVARLLEAEGFKKVNSVWQLKTGRRI
ncbi:hypothetical protein F5B21DRAFT_484715 [Xylaria acuta]|nr:hypothetical protein F5B21DRAFT_484715 [Xylaria acuta]